MASPQKEDGYIPIACEIADALMRVNLSAHESRVLWFLFRKTYGFHKKTDWITLSQFSKSIGIDRRLVHRAIKKLSSKGMTVIQRDDRGHIKYGFQKDYEKWKVSSKEMTVIYSVHELSSKEIPTIDTIQKIKDNSSSKNKKNGNCPYQEMVDCYHEILSDLTRVRVMTPKRKTQAKKIWEDPTVGKDIERWRGYLEHVGKSKFLMGGTFTDFEWITKYDNFIKIIEGKYHG